MSVCKRIRRGDSAIIITTLVKISNTLFARGRGISFMKSAYYTIDLGIILDVMMVFISTMRVPPLPIVAIDFIPILC